MNKYDLSQNDIDRIFIEMILPQIIGNTLPQSKKEAFILGGQPGSGKSALVRELLKLNTNTVFINGDDLRSYHPKYYFYLKQNDQEAADLTQAVCNYWVEALIAECVKRNLNMIVEGTMRRKEAPLSTAKILKEANYFVNLIALSVPRELSLLSLEYRYSELKRLGRFARYTKKSSHDETYQNIETTLTELLNSELFEKIYIYSRIANGFREAIFDSQQKEAVLQTFREGRARLVEDKEKDFLLHINLEVKKCDFLIR